MPDAEPIRFHEDQALFREAVNYTAAETGFVSRLIEKDYFCTVLLQYLTAARCGLVLKGGTCLAKVHAGFYRLSEDLDFSIPTPAAVSRAGRSRRAVGAKAAVSGIGEGLAGFRLITALTGARDSSQYVALVGYPSLVSRREESIRIEVGLREPLLTPEISGEARTLLRDPVTGSPLLPVLSVPCLSRTEAMAEKLRAALSRREVAIRDFYDLDHMVRRLKISLLEPDLLSLLRKKLAVTGNEPADVSPARLAALRPQLESELKAVLRARDFAEFDLERAVATVAEVAAALGRAA